MQPEPGDLAAALVANTTEVDELRAALARAQRAARRKELATEELVAAVYRAAKDAMLAIGPAPKIPAPPKDRRTRRAEVAAVHWTDWQCGKVTESFSMDILASRIRQSSEKIAEIVDTQRAAHPVRECHVMVGGDMIEGVGIFPGQAFEVEASAFTQVMTASAILESNLTFLLGVFDKVHVWEEKGNHGRLGRKGDHPAGDNLDLLMYTLTRQRMNSDRLVWHPFKGGIGTHVHIGNYTAFLFHGDEIKSFGGNTPAFGILRKLNAWATGVVAPFHDAYGGHFHHSLGLTMANGGRIWITGSPESGNEYAKEFVAATSIPSQRLHFVDPDKARVTSEWVLWLE